MSTEEKKEIDSRDMSRILVCPFHGRINPIPAKIKRKVPVLGKDKKEELVEKELSGFRCSGENCEITRTDKETEKIEA